MKKMFIICTILMLLSTAVETYANDYTVLTVSGKNINVINGKEKRQLLARERITSETIISIPYGCIVELFDMTTKTKHILKVPGSAKVKDLVANKKNTTRKLTGQYLAFVEQQIKSGGETVARKVSDPATITRMKHGIGDSLCCDSIQADTLSTDTITK
jgi:hypothetical protein